LSGKDRSGQNEKIQELALQAFRAWAWSFTEGSMCACRAPATRSCSVNTIPGMTETSLLLEAAAAVAINYIDFAFVSNCRTREGSALQDEATATNARAQSTPVQLRQRRQQHLLDVSVRPRKAVRTATADCSLCSEDRAGDSVGRGFMSAPGSRPSGSSSTTRTTSATSKCRLMELCSATRF
jgi:hypothetical protein